MKVVRLRERVAEDLRKFVEGHKEKFISQTNFVNEAVKEKLEREKETEYTAEKVMERLEGVSPKMVDTFSRIIKNSKKAKAITLTFMDLTLDADDFSIIEGNTEKICKEIKKDISKKNIPLAGVYLILKQPEGSQPPDVFDFLTEIDKCLPSQASKILLREQDKLSKEIYGYMILKYKKSKKEEKMNQKGTKGENGKE